MDRRKPGQRPDLVLVSGANSTPTSIGNGPVAYDFRPPKGVCFMPPKTVCNAVASSVAGSRCGNADGCVCFRAAASAVAPGPERVAWWSGLGRRLPASYLLNCSAQPSPRSSGSAVLQRRSADGLFSLSEEEMGPEGGPQAQVGFGLGAEGGTRTHTGLSPQRFLRPSRLPFRHFGQVRERGSRTALQRCRVRESAGVRALGAILAGDWRIPPGSRHVGRC